MNHRARVTISSQKDPKLAPSNKTPTIPTREDILEFIRNATGKVTKREIARAFHVRGPDKVHLKKILREMTDDGLLAKDEVSRGLRSGDDLPRVMVIRCTGVDAHGHVNVTPDEWAEENPAPEIRVAEGKDGKKSSKGPALGKGDRALARLEKISDEPARYRAHVMKRFKEEPTGILAIFRGGENGGRLHPIDKKNRDEYLVSVDDMGGAEDGELVLAEINKRGRRVMGPKTARVRECLGSVKSAKSISMIAIHAHGIPIDFPEAATKAAENAKPPTLKGRTDLRDIPLITIDPADARDHDDAIFAERDTDPKNPGGWHIIVAIADVAAYVSPGSPLDQEARKRGNSCYFPDRVVPMLPEALSAGLCSLQPNKERACLACHMWLDAKGRKIRHHFERGLMKSHANISYTEAQHALEGTPCIKTEPLVETVLKPLYGAYKALMVDRGRREPLDLDLPERKIELNEDGTVRTISLRERFDAHRIVEEYMISANVAAAEALESKSVPPVYRVHEEPSMDKLESLRGFLDTLGLKLAKGVVLMPRLFNGILAQVRGEPEEHMVNEVVLRSQTQAYYGPENEGHFGLALQKYAHFTSPIRRYADLLVHRGLIRAYGMGNDGLSDADIEVIEETAEHISQTERRAMAAERDSTDRYMASYLSDRIGQEFTGRISSATRFGLFVTLEPSGGDGLIPISALGHDFFSLDKTGHSLIGERYGTRYRIGDRLNVRLLEANIDTGGLRLELIPDDDQPEFKASKRTRRRSSGKKYEKSSKPDGKKHKSAKSGPPAARKEKPKKNPTKASSKKRSKSNSKRPPQL